MSLYTLSIVLKMTNKTLGIIIIVFGIIALFSEQEFSWVVSAISLGVGAVIFFWKDTDNESNLKK